MSNSLLTNCGTGCITATYFNLNQYLDTNDVLQFVLHTGSANQILNEILRSNTPTFCFNTATMSYGVTYYISAVVGDPDVQGNVILTDDCTVVSIGTPIVFYAIPVASIATPNPLSCLAQQVPVQGSSSLPNSTFSWTTQGGTIIGAANTPTIQVGTAGTYTLTVTNAGGSTTVGTITVADLLPGGLTFNGTSPFTVNNFTLRHHDSHL